MKAMLITQFGGPEVFEEREVPLPQPQTHEILVKVHATSVNPHAVLSDNSCFLRVLPTWLA